MGADASTLKKHLETASKTGALNLSDMKLKKVHDKVLQLPNLRTLDMSKNALTEIPEPLGSMAGMKHFNVAYNAIPQLPPAVRSARRQPHVLAQSTCRPGMRFICACSCSLRGRAVKWSTFLATS